MLCLCVFRSSARARSKAILMFFISATKDLGVDIRLQAGLHGPWLVMALKFKQGKVP